MGTCQARLPLIPSCVAVAVCVVPVPLCFAPSRSALIHLPSPVSQSTGSCRRKRRVLREGVRERTTKTHQSTRSYLLSSKTSTLLPGMLTKERQRITDKERQRGGACSARIRRNSPFSSSTIVVGVVVVSLPKIQTATVVFGCSKTQNDNTGIKY